jgi:hypothetical protein
MSDQPMDDEGDVKSMVDTSRDSIASTHSMAGLRFSSELMASHSEMALNYHSEALAVTGGDGKTGFSYTSLPERGVFATKKGKPLQTTPGAKFNGSIKTKDSHTNNHHLTDAELINVYRFETNTIDVKPQDTAKIYPAEFAKVPQKFNDQDRGINRKLKVVTGPALGYVYACGEAQHTETESQSKLKQIRKFRNGLAPLDKLSLIEDELDQIVQMNGYKLSKPYNQKADTTQQPPTDLLPHLTKGEYESIRKQIYENKGSRTHQGQMRGVHNIQALSLGEDVVENESQSTFKPNASITITVPNSDVSASALHDDHAQLLLSDRCNDEEEEEEFNIADFATPRSEDERAEVAEKKKRREEKERLKKLQMQTFRERRPFRAVKKDPTRLANQLPRSKTGEYLVKDHAQGKSNHLFEFNKDLGFEQEAEYHPSFRHTKNKLKSKKDKVFLKGPEESINNDTFGLKRPPGDEEEEDIMSPSTHISVDCHGTYGRAEGRQPMRLRYDTGIETLAEKEVTGILPGFIKTMVMKKEEIRHRLPCRVCRHDAVYWCVECAENYCKLCWNSIGHHEYVDPDEVWNNRKPDNAIEYKPNDEVGMNVFLTPGEIKQGRPRKIRTPQPSARPRSPPLQSFAFPPPDGVLLDTSGHSYTPHRGDLEWKARSSSSSQRRKPAAGGGGGVGTRSKGRGLRASAPPRHSEPEALHDLVVSPPKNRPPPGMSQSNSPLLLSPSSPSSRPHSPTNPSRTPGNQSPNDSLSNLSPTNSQNKETQLPREDSPAAPVETKKHQPVVMDPVPKQTLIWQVAASGRSLCPVSSLHPGKYMHPARGITSEFFPKDWQAGREEIHREYQIYNGVTVATRIASPSDPDPAKSSGKNVKGDNDKRATQNKGKKGESVRMEQPSFRI